jgi:two-component system response regulator AtoC
MPERRTATPLPPTLKRILLVDDEPNMRAALGLMLEQEGLEVIQAEDGEAALRIVERQSFDVILCDIQMPKLDGWQFLDAIRDLNETAVVIMMSGQGDRDTALEVMKRGAYDYIEKPFRSDDVLLALRKAEERERLRLENQALRETVRRESSFENIISQSPKMLEIFAIIRKISEYKTTVLISGESGTGKELIARALHFNSPRRDNPFVAINCGAIPENLLESELFGHTKGAFTDAVRDKKGLFELATTGTLFLDEIGEMPLSLQVKLLRVLQENEIRRVGGDHPIKVDVRVVAATVKDVAKEVREGRFREDLYYRLNVLSILLPPLRERREDIPILVDHFREKHAKKLGVGQTQITKPAVRLLLEYHWPGNIRELENVLERATVLCDGTIEPQHLPPPVLEPQLRAGDVSGDGENPLSMKLKVRKLEESLIRRALEISNANRTRAAKLLEISHRTLLYKMHEYGIK